MKLFTRTPSPRSVHPPLSPKPPSFDHPSPPRRSHPLHSASSTDTHDTSSSSSSSSSTTTTPPITPVHLPSNVSTTPSSPPLPTPSSSSSASASALASTPRRPRLYHGAPPFYQCWATVRHPQGRRPSLRFCTVSGPMLRLSATPAADVLASSVCVYGAAVTTDDFPSQRIVVRTVDARLVLCADTRDDHVNLAAQLCAAARRSILSHYVFVAHVRASFFSRVCDAADACGQPMTVKLSTKARLSVRLAALARREPVLLLAIPHHPAVPRLQDVYDSPRAYYVVTAGAAQPTLRDVYARRGPFGEGDVAVVIADLLSALAHLRRARVAHRFISPATVVVSADACRVRSACVVDFEMAVLVDDHKHDIDVPSVLHVLREEPAMCALHAPYVPPEVFGAEALPSDSDLDHDINDAFAQDVWAVGMVMHWMLVGCTPFDTHVADFDAVKRLVADARGMPVFSGPLWRGVTSGAKHLCASLLHADVKARLAPYRALQHPWLRL